MAYVKAKRALHLGDTRDDLPSIEIAPHDSVATADVGCDVLGPILSRCLAELGRGQLRGAGDAAKEQSIG